MRCVLKYKKFFWEKLQITQTIKICAKRAGAWKRKYFLRMSDQHTMGPISLSIRVILPCIQFHVGIISSCSNRFGPYFLLTDTLGLYFVPRESGHHIYILMIQKIVVKKKTDVPSTRGHNWPSWHRMRKCSFFVSHAGSHSQLTIMTQNEKVLIFRQPHGVKTDLLDV